MRFWDTSAVLPLLVREKSSQALQALRLEDSAISVWWGTRVEVASGLARLVRDRSLTDADGHKLLGRMDALVATWSEVLASDLLRNHALRLLRIHSLRVADALQLAAALVAADRHPEALPLVTLDPRLGEAAMREGFAVLP